nr:MAG TPA: hypothetical protein [Caudoviricetes sp.]
MIPYHSEKNRSYQIGTKFLKYSLYYHKIPFILILLLINHIYN